MALSESCLLFLDFFPAQLLEWQRRGRRPPPAQWFLDAKIITKQTYLESFLGTKVRKLCEDKICQSFLQIALGHVPGQAVRSITLSTKIVPRQKLLVSRGMDALCGSKSAKQKRKCGAAAACHSSPTWRLGRGDGGGGEPSLFFPYSSCTKTTHV